MDTSRDPKPVLELKETKPMKRMSPTILFKDDEVKVVGILRRLPSLVFAERSKLNGRASSRLIALSWVGKRKRSDAVEPLGSSPVETPEASSPSPPLSFCPTETDKRPFKLPKQILEEGLKKFQKHLQMLHGENSLLHCESMLQNTLDNITRSHETDKHEEVPPLDLELRLGLPAINHNEQEAQNIVQQQIQQKITLEVKLIKEETTIPREDQFCSSMDTAISLPKQARPGRAKNLGENRSNRLKFFKSFK